MPKQAHLLGRIFGRLKVLRQNGTTKNYEKLWLCQCECGNQVTTRTSSLTKDITKSCGCFQRDTARERHITHGMTKAPIYSVYKGMVKRCYNQRYHNYYLYGERGITVCERWLEGFENFYEDMKDGYSPGLSLERTDNNAGYSKDNCRWATTKEQNNNTRQNIYYVCDGSQYTMAQLAEMFGIKYNALRKRLRVSNWPLDKAISTPVRERGVI